MGVSSRRRTTRSFVIQLLVFLQALLGIAESESAVGSVNGNPGSAEATGSSGSGGGHPALTGSTSNGRCEEITIPMCTSIGYNLTAMPNELNHATQEEAHLEIHQYLPLVRVGCSPDLKFFLCSMYTPKCLPEYTKPLPACRSVCESVRASCTPLMQRFGFWWPESLACERLPNHGDPENLCMEQDNHTSSSPVPAPPRPTKSSIPTQTPRYTSQQTAWRQTETSIKVVIERITELCRRLTAEEVIKAEYTEGEKAEVPSVKKEEEDGKMEALRKEVEEVKKEVKETRRLVEKIAEYLEDKKRDEAEAEGLTPPVESNRGETEKVDKVTISEEGKERIRVEQELREREKRKKNIVIKGLQEQGTQWDIVVQRVMNETLGKGVKIRQGWVTKEERGENVYIIELENEEDREAILGKRQEIEEKEKLWVGRDLTFEERVAQSKESERGKEETRTEAKEEIEKERQSEREEKEIKRKIKELEEALTKLRK